MCVAKRIQDSLKRRTRLEAPLNKRAAVNCRHDMPQLARIFHDALTRLRRWGGSPTYEQNPVGCSIQQASQRTRSNGLRKAFHFRMDRLHLVKIIDGAPFDLKTVA